MSPYLSALTPVNMSTLNCLLLAEQYLNAWWQQWEMNGRQTNPFQLRIKLRLLPSSLIWCWSLDRKWRDQWVCWQVATASAFMERLHGWEEGGWNGSDKPEGTVQDFHWMGRTNLHLSQCQQKDKRFHRWCRRLLSTFCYRMLLLPDESGKKSLIFGECPCGEKFSFIFAIFWI